MARTVIQVCADIVEQYVLEGDVCPLLRAEAERHNVNVSALTDMAEDLYGLATEEVEDAFDND